MIPRVSFVVPCYKHGQFLRACVDSILAQSFEAFEVLVMDDCSPDETPEVARSITDPRVIHVRNERNLGHLANYNKGIGLARGEYVWLINVDDYLRRPHVLEKFVAVMDRVPSASYVFCPAVSVRGTTESAPHAVHASSDTIFRSADFLERLLEVNCVPTPAAMVRRTSYERGGVFPLDLPYAGDWFQWCRHAFYGDVAFVAEPMVCYRIHETNMSKWYVERPERLIADEVEVRWRVLRMAQQVGLQRIADAAVDAIGDDYARRVARGQAEQWPLGMTVDQFTASLRAHTTDQRLIDRITARVQWSVADDCYKRGNTRLAAAHYRQALALNPRDLATWAKCGLLAAGPAGRTLRSAAAHLRQRLGGQG